MREILFRGKAINRNRGYYRTKYKNGDWVYGLVTRLYDERFETLPAEMTNTDGVSGIDVDYRSIGQYTGLTDKNGKKIFEGDIVKGLFLFGKEVRSQVVFKDGAFGLEWVRGNAIEFNAFTSLCNIEFEVVGNIYEKNQSEEV